MDAGLKFHAVVSCLVKAAREDDFISTVPRFRILSYAGIATCSTWVVVRIAVNIELQRVGVFNHRTSLSHTYGLNLLNNTPTCGMAHTMQPIPRDNCNVLFE